MYPNTDSGLKTSTRISLNIYNCDSRTLTRITNMKTCEIAILLLTICIGSSCVKASPSGFTALLDHIYKSMDKHELTKAEMTTIIGDLAKRFNKIDATSVSRTVGLVSTKQLFACQFVG